MKMEKSVLKNTQLLRRIKMKTFTNKEKARQYILTHSNWDKEDIADWTKEELLRGSNKIQRVNLIIKRNSKDKATEQITSQAS